MIRYHRAILTLSIAVCVLLCTGTRSLGQGFKWDTVKHNGAEYVTLSSVKNFYYFDTIKYGKKIVIYRKVKMVKEKGRVDRLIEVEIEFASGSQRCEMNGVLFILSSPIVAVNGRYLLSKTDLLYLVDPVLRPEHIHNASGIRTVVVDAGHGGHDSGSLGVFDNEKVYTLKIARLVRGMLQKKGYRVVMTRDSDVFVSLANRVKIANKHPDAVFLSIHFNSGNARANGIETFTISPVGVPHMDRGFRPRDNRVVPGNMMGSASIALATVAHSRTFLYLNNIKHGNNFHIKDRGIKRARFNVLTGIKIPAILVEGGFISNRAEAQKIHSVAYQKKLAEALAKSVGIYSNSVRSKAR